MDLAQAINSLNEKLGRVGLSDIIKTFNGDQTKFNSWIKSINKCAVINNIPDEKKIQLAFQFSSDKVSDFIQRHLEHNQQITWAELKAELESRFGEVRNKELKFAELTRIKQHQGENVQNFADRIMALAEEAYEGIGDGLQVVEQQLIMFFTEGLIQPSVRAKVIRENPRTFQNAVTLATGEQNICARIKRRSQFEGAVAQENTRDDRQLEPMEVNHTRRQHKSCSYCRRSGHVISECRVRQKSQINEVREAVKNTNNGSKNGRCWFCGRQGHFQSECRDWKNLQGTNQNKKYKGQEN
jgi:hypothetical protein